jgi:hypothetical protein
MLTFQRLFIGLTILLNPLLLLEFRRRGGLRAFAWRPDEFGRAFDCARDLRAKIA